MYKKIFTILFIFLLGALTGFNTKTEIQEGPYVLITQQPVNGIQQVMVRTNLKNENDYVEAISLADSSRKQLYVNGELDVENMLNMRASK